MALTNVKILKRPKKTAGAVGGACSGNGFTTPTSAAGAVTKALFAESSAYAERAGLAANANKADTAAEAAHAAKAADLDADTPYTDRIKELFLSRLADDVAKGKITFEKAAQFVAGFISEGVTRHNGGARFGEFVQGLTGAVIDAGGNAEVESITVRSYLKVMELIYNRLNALEGDFSFSDSGTIEAIEDLGDGTFAALMRRRWDGDFTSFQEGDIIYSYVNRLDSTGEYYKAWAVVRAVDRENNMLRIRHYSDAQVPSGHNYPMAANMLVARWGNEIPPSAGTHRDFPAFILDKGNGKYVNTRQSLFLISAEEGNIRQLMGVDSPILRPGCFATVLGRIPDGLLDEKTEELINKEQPYLYARGIVVQDIIRVNYQGVIQRTANYRGVWDAATAASATDYYAVTESAYDTVTHKGALWMCLSNATTEEPSEKTTAWRAMTAEESTHIEYRYKTAKEGTVPAVMVFVNASTGKEDRNPTGWATLPPQVAEGYALWRIQADINPDDTRASDWSDPVRISGFPGKDGDDGAPGLDGRDGLMVYPAGEYDPTELYEDKNGSVPVVLYNGRYYVLSRGAQYCGDQEPDSRYNTPAKEYANSPAGTARWSPLENFNSIFANILMANFAKLGSAVFYGDWMISQQGTLTGSDGTVTLNSTAYEHFKDGSFEPNYSVNFLTGEMRAGAGTFSGTLTTRFKPLSESDAVVMGNTVTLRNDLKLMFSNDFNGMVNIPTEPSYVGQHITLCDYRQSAYVAGSEAGVHLRVIGNGNSLIYGGRANGETSAVYACSSLAFRSGIVELIAIPDNPNVSYGQQPTVGRCRWYILTAQADFLKYYKIGEIV